MGIAADLISTPRHRGHSPLSSWTRAQHSGANPLFCGHGIIRRVTHLFCIFLPFSPVFMPAASHSHRGHEGCQGGFGQFGALPWWVWCPCDRTVASEWCSLDKCKCQARTSTRTRSRAEHREPPHSRRIGAKVVFCMIKSYKVLFRANLPNLHSAFLGSTAPGPAAKQTTKPTTVCIKEQH